MVFRLIDKKYCIASNGEMKENLNCGNDFKFNIKASDFATNTKMLNIFHLVSMFSEKVDIYPRGSYIQHKTKEDCRNYAQSWFCSYLDSFCRNEPELKTSDTLHVMVVDEDMQKKILPLIKTT